MSPSIIYSSTGNLDFSLYLKSSVTVGYNVSFEVLKRLNKTISIIFKMFLKLTVSLTLLFHGKRHLEILAL